MLQVKNVRNVNPGISISKAQILMGAQIVNVIVQERIMASGFAITEVENAFAKEMFSQEDVENVKMVTMDCKRLTCLDVKVRSSHPLLPRIIFIDITIQWQIN